jgi:dienelactone hydrolase
VLTGQLISPDGPGPHPGVLVMHDAHGLGPQSRERAQRLAALGYVALATDMYGGGAYFESQLGSGPTFMALFERPDYLRARVVAGYDALKGRPDVDPDRIAAVGFCFGGMCVLELARSGVDVKAVVSFHGLLTTALPAGPDLIKGQVVAFCGGKDPYAPLEQVDGLRDEMTKAGAPWAVTVYGEAYHAFTNPDGGTGELPGIAYDPLSDTLSWASTVALLAEVLG